MTIYAPAPADIAAPTPRPAGLDGLPASAEAAPVRLDLGSFPVLVAWIRPDTWSVTEIIGGARVVHGHLRVVGPRYAMAAAGGTRPAHRDWRTVIARHLGAN
ncbi:hypothetical protein [Frigoribacterium salinisoli]